MKTPLLGSAVLLAVTLLAPPRASAQFDPLHNHLECYKIKGDAITTRLRVDGQLGAGQVAQLKPALLCTPAQKTCCDPTVALGCQQIACAPDPAPNQPAPVDHFTCYKMKVKACADAACTTLTKPPKDVRVDLADQFGTHAGVAVGAPQLLCTPVSKVVVSPTTTTSSSTTTTTQPALCQISPDATTCGGECPPGMTCGTMNGDPGTCVCYPDQTLCAAPGGPGTCNLGACPGPDPFQVCSINPATQACECYAPCGRNPFQCSGVCPQAFQVCAGQPGTCRCCSPAAGPCFGPSDCCSGVCIANACQ